MTFNFPNLPTPGQTYSPAGGLVYQWDGTAWRSTEQGAPATIRIADAPPANPVHGQLWWESDTSNFFAYYDDGDSAQWVQISGPMGVEGPVGPIGPPGGGFYGTALEIPAVFVPGTIYAIQTNGYSSPGDGGAASYKRVGMEPAHAGKLQSADGAWWEIAEYPVRTRQFGGGTPAQNKTALLAALGVASAVIVNPGEYEQTDITLSNKKLYMLPGVTFKVANGAIVAPATEGPPALKISGANVVIAGDFTCDGNYANQDVSAFGSGNRIGTLHISGANARIEGKATVNNAFYRGLVIGNGDNAGDEVLNTFIDAAKVVNARSYSVMVWTAKDWHIRTIEVVKGADSLDARVRTGTQNSSTGQTLNGKIGEILTDDSVVGEAKTRGLQINSIRAISCKFEDCQRVQVNSIYIDAALLVTAGLGFGLINTTDCQFGVVHVKDYAGSTDAVSITGTPTTGGTHRVTINSILVTGTISNVNDIRIRVGTNISIGTAVFMNPVGTGFGFFYDYNAAYAPQNNVFVGSIISKGHTSADVSIGGTTQIKVGYINLDATVAGTEAIRAQNPIAFSTQSATVAMTCDTGSVTLVAGNNILNVVKIGRLVFVQGELRVSAITSPTGVLNITGLPYVCSDLGGTSDSATFVVKTANMSASTGVIIGSITVGQTSILLQSYAAGVTGSAAAFLTATSRFTVNGFYMTD